MHVRVKTVSRRPATSRVAVRRLMRWAWSHGMMVSSPVWSIRRHCRPGSARLTSISYAGEFARTGFRGGLNWYRNIDRNWELLAPFAGRASRSQGYTLPATGTSSLPFAAWISCSPT
jgi:hypothetical protein